MIMHITENSEFDNEIQAPKVLVDFFATWCGPCSSLSPIVEEIAAENPDLKVIKIDVDQAHEIAAKFDVYSIPTLLYIENGKVIRQQVGYMPKSSLLKFLGL